VQNLTGKEECLKLCLHTVLRAEKSGEAELLVEESLRKVLSCKEVDELGYQGGKRAGVRRGTIGSRNFDFDAATSILFFTLSHNFSIWKKGDKIAARRGIFFQSVATGITGEAIQLSLGA
jgi:hypothetical protein